MVFWLVLSSVHVVNLSAFLTQWFFLFPFLGWSPSILNISKGKVQAIAGWETDVIGSPVPLLWPQCKHRVWSKAVNTDCKQEFISGSFFFFLSKLLYCPCLLFLHSSLLLAYILILLFSLTSQFSICFLRSFWIRNPRWSSLASFCHFFI